MQKTDRISPGKQKNIDTVKSLKEKLVRAKSIFLTEYRGLTHQQLEMLRKSLKKVKAEFIVAKNTLLKIAMKEWHAETVKEFEAHLKNPTATFLAYDDDIAAIKELAAFITKIQLPKIKLGLFGGKLATEKDFTTLSMLPTHDQLLAILAIRLKSPIYGLHYALRWNLQKFVTALNNVKEKKPAN